MTNDLRERAKALITEFDNDNSGVYNMRVIRAIDDLKAALIPSRKEIADYLECEILEKWNTEGADGMVKYAIEELRKDKKEE